MRIRVPSVPLEQLVLALSLAGLWSWTYRSESKLWLPSCPRRLDPPCSCQPSAKSPRSMHRSAFEALVPPSPLPKAPRQVESARKRTKTVVCAENCAQTTCEAFQNESNSRLRADLRITHNCAQYSVSVNERKQREQ